MIAVPGHRLEGDGVAFQFGTAGVLLPEIGKGIGDEPSNGSHPSFVDADLYQTVSNPGNA